MSQERRDKRGGPRDGKNPSPRGPVAPARAGARPSPSRPARPAPPPAKEPTPRGRAEASPAAERKTQERTCVGCRKQGGRDDLFRLVEGPDGQIAVDARARAGGRGAWVHASRECIAQAAKRHAAERSLKVPVRDVDAAAITAGVRAALIRKAESLLITMRRTRTLAAGSTAVAERLEGQPVPLVIVALDAGESARKALGPEGSRGDGGDDRNGDEGDGGVIVRAFGTKGSLGTLLGRGEVAIVAALDPSIAQELLSTIDRLAGLEG